VTCALKRAGRINSQVIAIVTDLDVHKIWLADGIDTYAIASAFTKKKLQKLGVAEEKIVVTGIPTHANFAKACNVTALKKIMGLPRDEFTILMATGSFGIGPIEEIIKILDGVQIIVVCGSYSFLHLKSTNLSIITNFPLNLIFCN